MTQEELQKVNAAMRYLEAQIANMAREGANLASVLEDVSMQLKAAKAEIEALKKPENVVPIKGDTA